jgi:hypothetical protein
VWGRSRLRACWFVTGGLAEYVKAGRLRSAGRNVRRGLSRADVEALACEVYPWWDHLEDEDSYGITAQGARRILGSTTPG